MEGSGKTDRGRRVTSARTRIDNAWTAGFLWGISAGAVAVLIAVRIGPPIMEAIRSW